MNALNSVPVLKRRIIDGKAIEYDFLEGISPIMNKHERTYCEMRVKTPQVFDDIIDWHEYIKILSKDINRQKRKFFHGHRKKKFGKYRKPVLYSMG